MTALAEMIPFGVPIDLASGVMTDPDVHLVRRASDMRGYYADEAALESLIDHQNDPLHYEVFECEIPETKGHLRFCISKLQPGRVGDEYFMTKGHYHTIAHTAEIYLGLMGKGYMLNKLPSGECHAEPIAKNQMVYVPPYWAHRSINTGDEPLISFCVYPAEAGHNYGDIITEGLPKRVMLREGTEVIIDA